MTKIEILGAGCPKCKQLFANTEIALKELGISAEVFKVTDIAKIIEYDVMMVPALAVDGAVVSAGKELSKDEIKKILSGMKQR
ncbi:MAG: thioredoxin family protein [Candidatus Omnitrophota bacterium]